MAAIAANIKYFDTLEFVEKSKKLGIPEEAAKFQVNQIEQAIEAAVTNVEKEMSKVKDKMGALDLATKGDVRESELRLLREIEVVRYATLKFVISTGVGVVVTLGGTLGGMIAKGFHWW
jgi:hypothetical protein